MSGRSCSLLVCGIAGLFFTVGVAGITRSASAAASLGTNLILNPGAEAGAGSDDGSVVTVPDWTVTGQLTAVQYGAAGGFPLLTDPGPTDRGLNFFAGGPDSAVSTGTQTIDISALATQIDSGVSFDLNGWFGGFQSQGDNAVLAAEFLSVTSVDLGSTSVGGVSAADRDNATGLLFRDITGTVPVGTRSILLTLTSTREAGTYDDGYADNLSLILSGGSTPPPGVPLPAAVWQATGLLAILCGIGLYRWSRRASVN